MGKRFTDTTLWNRPWFRKLSPVEKCAYFFIKDFCDNVGVWVPDFEVEDFYIKGKVDWDKLRQHCNKNIIELENGKWFLPDFCDFQYGELKETCAPHRSYLELLRKHGLEKGYSKGINTLQEKELEKELEKEKDKRDKHGDIVTLDSEKYDVLCYQYGKKTVDSKIDDINNYCLSKGKRYKDYAATIRAWFKKDGVPPKVGEVKRCANGHMYTGDICEQCI